MTANGIERNMNARVTSLGLTATQSHILHYICRKSGEVHQRDVEKEFDLSHATVSGIIDRLVSKGFVEKIRSEIDGRFYALCATKKALEYEENIHAYILESENQMLSGLSSDETGALRSALTKILINSGFVPPEKLVCRKEYK